MRALPSPERPSPWAGLALYVRHVARLEHPGRKAAFSPGGDRDIVRPLPIPTLERIRKRPDFLAAAKGASLARGAVVVQMRARPDADGPIRVGFTATRKVGGSVVRNRAKRRLREAARALLPELGRPGFDYVLIARGGTPAREWARLLDDVKSALIRLAADSEARRASDRPSDRP